MHACKRRKRKKNESKVHTYIHDPCYFMHISVCMYTHIISSIFFCSSFFYAYFLLYYYGVYLLDYYLIDSDLLECRRKKNERREGQTTNE